MTHLEQLNMTLLIANLRALTHEIARAQTAQEQLDPEDDKVTEIGLYLQDLLMTQSVMADEYESRRTADGDAADFTEVDVLLVHFGAEKFV